MKVKRIAIGIKDLKGSLKDFSEAWKKLESGKKIKREQSLYFDSIDTMRNVLTNKRLMILKTIRKDKPGSLYELAKLLDRDLKSVNQDVKFLSEAGLVTLEKLERERKRVIPHVEYGKILLEIAV
jgi:predicted transcriptional regulator